MAIAEGILHYLSGPALWHPILQSDSVLKSNLSYSGFLTCTKKLEGSRGKRNLLKFGSCYRRENYVLPWRSSRVKRLDCLSSDSLNGPSYSSGGEEYKPNSNDVNVNLHVNEVISSEKLAAAAAKSEKALRINADSLEDEAWELLRESIVCYCGSPVGK